MSAVTKPIGSAFNFLLAPPMKLLGLSPSVPTIPNAPSMPTRDDAAANAAAQDDLRRRKGSAANILLGSAGAEAGASSTATKTLLGS